MISELKTPNTIGYYTTNEISREINIPIGLCKRSVIQTLEIDLYSLSEYAYYCPFEITAARLK